MIDERYIELMNGEIDGANSEEETAALSRYLEASPEGRGYFARLREVAEAFRRAGEITPPVGLDRIILSSIAAREKPRPATRRGLGSLELLRPPRKFAFGFAVGVAAGLIILAIVYRSMPAKPDIGVENFYGTFAANRGSVLSTERIPVSAPGVSGTVEVHYLERAVRVSLSFDTSKEIEVRVTPAGGLPLTGVLPRIEPGWRLASDRAGTTITVAGRSSVELGYADDRDTHPAVRVTVRAGSETILDRTVEGARESGH
jgi:hypothetical protein